MYNDKSNPFFYYQIQIKPLFLIRMTDCIVLSVNKTVFHTACSIYTINQQKSEEYYREYDTLWLDWRKRGLWWVVRHVTSPLSNPFSVNQRTVNKYWPFIMKYGPFHISSETTIGPYCFLSPPNSLGVTLPFHLLPNIGVPLSWFIKLHHFMIQWRVWVLARYLIKMVHGYGEVRVFGVETLI